MLPCLRRLRMKRKNPVAKFQCRYNKAKVFKDRKREEKKNPKTYAEYMELEKNNGV